MHCVKTLFLAELRQTMKRTSRRIASDLAMIWTRYFLSTGISYHCVNLFNGRILRILMMVYNTHNYWVSGLCPSSGILDVLCFLVFRIPDDG
jgi:hypothetical protein